MVTLIQGEPGRRLGPVKDEEGDGVVQNVGGGPDPGHGEGVDGDGEQDEVADHHDEDVDEPRSPLVHVARIRVLVAMTSLNHLGSVRRNP